LVTANRAALRLFRMKSAQELAGRPAAEFFSGDNAWVADAVKRVRSTGQQDVAMDVDIWLPPPPNGERPVTEGRRERASVNLSAVPLKSGKGADIGSLVVLEDITNEKRLRGTMARYMPKEVADKLLQEGDAVLGGQIQTATVLFTDIRSFTTIAERLGAHQTVQLLNEYFTLMVDVILDHGGILDKYIGDAIMAVFGAPFCGPHDADNAVQTAVGMMRVLQEFNRRRADLGQDALAIGIGHNTDGVLSGNIGSPKRMDYTVIGDGVNLASRLEGANKAYGTQILLSELTVRGLTGSYRMREVDRMRVKGKQEPVAVYEVLEHLGPEQAPRLDEMLRHYNSALVYYRQRDWRKAEQIFGDAVLISPDDGLSRMYRDRCRYFAEQPPDDDWDGVWVMASK
jgi:adenylate cyclase